MANFLSVEVQRSLRALLPLIDLTDGELHKTSSLPAAIYESPAHLDYVCQKLRDTRDANELQNSPKFQRLCEIDRVVHLSILPLSRLRRSIDCAKLIVSLSLLPLSRLRRFKPSAAGPFSTMMWSMRQIDPLARKASEHLEWAATGDEADIKRSFFEQISKTVGDTVGMVWWRGCNDQSHSGRFDPIPQQEEDVGDVVERLRVNLLHKGFTLRVSTK